MKNNNFMPKEKSVTEKFAYMVKELLPKFLGGKGSLKDKAEKIRDGMIIRENKK